MKLYVYLAVLLFASSLQTTSEKCTVWTIGDSTMADKPEKALPENGWGMAVGKFLKENVIVKNCAVNGRSSRSFMLEGRWDTICNKISKGDFVIIQFGHNDEKSYDTTRYTIPQTTYKEYLKKYITDTQSRGAYPVLCTPIVRRHFNNEGKLIDTHGEYPQAVRELAREMNVTLVDLQKLTEEKLTEMGPDNSKKLFLFLNPGEYPNFPDGKSDSTHLSIAGASIVAEQFINDIKKQNVAFNKLLK
jgi:lysophospholipase L1-like esterase